MAIQSMNIIFLKVKDKNALLMRTDSKSYNNSGKHYYIGKCSSCIGHKPYYPYWAPFDELYVNASEAK